jgi:hypothetical protein
MLVMISLNYPSDDGPMLLDIWNIEAPSVAAVERLIREDLGPSLRRHGRRKALELGFDEAEYCPQALSMQVEATPLCSLEELCGELADDRDSPLFDARHLQRCARPRHDGRVPAPVEAVLTRHGIRGPRGTRQAYRPPKPPKLVDGVADLFDDEPPF